MKYLKFSIAIVVLLTTMPAVWTLAIWLLGSRFLWERWSWSIIHTAFGFTVFGIGGVIQIIFYAKLIIREWKHLRSIPKLGMPATTR